MSGAEDLFKFGKKFKKDLEEKRGDWKSKLSGAFSSEQIFFSLFVLGVFYAGYTIANVDGHYDVDTKSEGDIIESCYCKSSHSKFYRGWFGFCCGLWLILHTYTYVAVKFRKCENFLTFIEAICTPKGFSKWSKYLLKGCYNCCCKRKHSDNTTETHGPKSQSDGSNLNAYIIQRYIKVLRFQYYKLYVIGYARGKDEKIILDQPVGESNDKEKDTNDEDDDKEKFTCYCCSAAYIEKNVEDSDEEQADDCACGCDKELSHCFNILKYVVRSFLLSVKYLAQLLTMPLLFLQIFDTYSLLCFSPRTLCSNSSDYKLHLAQAAITLSFYCCLALSQLASTMLTWNPWPKKDNKGDKKPEDRDNNNEV